MLEGFYTAASGILQQERTINVLTNNIVNAKTPGYRASRVVSTTFEHEYMTRIENYNTQQIGVASPIRIVSEVPTRFDAGMLEETGRPYDLAVSGPGYFVIENEAGEQYLTRNGNFDVDDEGYLILRGAGRVQGTSGPIQLEDAYFTVHPDGRITSDIDPDNEIGQLNLVDVPQDVQMKLAPNGLYTVDDMNTVTPLQADNTNLVQGCIERTNVDAGREYTLVMEAQRAFQACSTALQILDRINQKAAQQIASL